MKRVHKKFWHLLLNVQRDFYFTPWQHAFLERCYSVSASSSAIKSFINRSFSQSESKKETPYSCPHLHQILTYFIFLLAPLTLLDTSLDKLYVLQLPSSVFNWIIILFLPHDARIAKRYFVVVYCLCLSVRLSVTLVILWSHRLSCFESTCTNR